VCVAKCTRSESLSCCSAQLTIALLLSYSVLILYTCAALNASIYVALFSTSSFCTNGAAYLLVVYQSQPNTLLLSHSTVIHYLLMSMLRTSGSVIGSWHTAAAVSGTIAVPNGSLSIASAGTTCKQPTVGATAKVKVTAVTVSVCRDNNCESATEQRYSNTVAVAIQLAS
jgi:hypothetical protein